MGTLTLGAGGAYCRSAALMKSDDLSGREGVAEIKASKEELAARER
jgi:hypothetical protein